MGLISAKDFLTKRDSPPIAGGDGSDSSNNSPSLQLSKPTKGLMSATDFLKNKQMNHTSPEMSLDDTMASQHQVENAVGFTPKPTSNDMLVPSTIALAHPENSPFMQNIIHQNELSKAPMNHDMKTDYPGGWLNPLNDLGQLANSPLIRSFDNAAGKAIGLPDNMVNSAKPMGSPLLDKTVGFLGASAGYLTNPAMLEQGIGKNFFGNSLVQKAANKVGGAIENKLPNNFATNVLSKGAQAATIGGLGSVAYAPFNTLMSGQDVQDIPRNMLEQGIGGAAFGGALGGLGGALGKAVSSFLGRGKSVETPSIQPDQPILGLPEPRSAQRLRDAQQSSILEPNTSPIYGQGDIHTFGLPEGNYTEPTRFKTMGQQEQFSSAMDKVMPVAKERLIPPLENQNELAKWVQGHLNDAGHDVSLNEVRGLNYEDLRQLAEEMRPRIDATKTVGRVANEMGYGKIFNETTPSLKEQITKDAQSRAYGFPAPKVNIAKPDFNIIHNADAAMPETKIGFERKQPEFTQIKKGGAIDPSNPFQNKTNTVRPADASHLNVPSYVRDEIARNNAIAEKLGVADKIEELSAQGLTRQQIRNNLAPMMKGIDATEALQLVTSVKTFREIPSMDDKAEFASWLKNRNNPQVKANGQANAAPIEDAIQTKEPRIRDKVVSYLDEAEQAARDRLKAKRNTFSSNPIDQYADYAIIGASKLAKGTVKFADWSTHMVQEFGEGIKPHLKAIFDQSKTNIKEAERQASGVAHLPGVNSGIDPLKGNKVDIQSLEGAIENSANWKDKNRLLLNRETTNRNFEDVMGKDAPIMNKTYIEPIQKAAADRQRFITQERNDIKDLGIKYKSPEDALVQKYGEGKMSELELQAASPQNWQKIKTAAETMRSKYDEYLNMANEVLKRNGYPEIPKRKDYFPHYEEIDGLMHKLGFGFEDNTLPADLNGITANLKPGKNFFSHLLPRKGDDTTLGAMAGHDRYIEGISKIIHQTDNIKRLRGLDKTLRDTHEGTTHLADFLGNLTDYTNLLAGKKTELDRSPEAFGGRNFYSAVDWLKRKVGANMIGGSVSSALTNSIPVTQLLAETSKPSVLRGLASALQNPNANDVIGQGSNFLNRRFTSDKLAMGPIDKAQKIAGTLFKGIDHFTSNVVIRSKYYENLKNGMPEAEALHAADQYATRMMADRSEGSMPTLFHSKGLGVITQFQLEVNNQLSHLFKDMPKSMSKGKYASAITQVFVYDYLYNQLYEKVTGNRPAFDPLGVAVHAVQDYTNPRLSKGKASSNLMQNVGNNIPFANIITGGGRLPIDAAIPNVLGANGLIKGNAKLGDELLKPAKYLALPFGGSQINKTITGINAVNQGGIHGTDPQGRDILKYPIAQTPENYIRGALFGKSALPETNNFFQNNTPALTAKETEALSKHGNDPKMYDRIMIQKQMNSLDDKYSKIDNNPNLSKEEKRSQINAIKSKMRELKQSIK